MMTTAPARAAVRRILAAVLLLACVDPSRVLAAATITIVNEDDPGEGFNDTTPAAPVGGNTGTTLGQQRLIAAQYAADVWGALLDSPVEIRVSLTFDPLFCSATGAVLGATGANTVHRDFSGALRPATWYTQALANKLAGFDLSAQDDMSGTFNSSVGTTCALPRGWYYGLDASPTGFDLDFVTIALHEIAHGLGFLSLVDLNSGAKFNNRDDAYSVALENHSACKLYPTMSDAERAAASTDTGDLHWSGSAVVAASGVLGAGVHPSGHVEMYAPDPVNPGSSVSHFSNAASPNELLEPAYIGPTHDVGLAYELLLDIGWSGTPSTILGGQCGGGQFIVNTTRQGDQSEARIGMDGSGGAVAVWSSEHITNIFLPDVPGQDGSFSGVYGQRFDSAGARQGTEFQVHTYTINNQTNPDIAVGSGGDFVVVWRGDHDGSDTGVFAQRFDSAGLPLGGEFQVNSYTGGAQGFAPKIAADADGDFVVVWDDFRAGGTSDVFGQRFDSAGVKLGTEFQINTFTPNSQGDNGLAVAAAADGSFTVAWKSSQQDSAEFGFGVDGGVFAQRFASDGSRDGLEFQVNTYTRGDQGTFSLDIDMDPAGNAIVIWHGVNDGDPYPNVVPYGGILGQRLDSTGAKVGSEFVVPSTIRGLQVDATAAMSPDGSVLIAWADFPRWPPPSLPHYVRNEIDVRAQRFDSAGARVGAEFVVNSYRPQSQRYPGLAADADGFVVVWTSETCSGDDEFLCLDSEDGMSGGVLMQRYRTTAPVCGPTPRTSCYGSDSSGISLGASGFKWTWRKGAPLNTGHFGNPLAMTSYALCVYQAGAPTNPVIDAAIPAGGLCGTKPCWKANGSGYRYKSSSGAADGITGLQLKAGEEGKSRIVVKGAGPALTPALPFAPYTSLTVQLVNSNEECFEAAYTAPASRNLGSGFKDKF